MVFNQSRLNHEVPSGLDGSCQSFHFCKTTPKNSGKTSKKQQKRASVSLFFRVPNRRKARISAANKATLAVNFLEEQRKTANYIKSRAYADGAKCQVLVMP